MAINLLPATRLVSLAKGIESTFPGFWYSISQSDDTVVFNIGPSTACPELKDRQFSKTLVGDKGFVLKLPFTAIDDTTLCTIIRRVLDWEDGCMTGHFPDVRQTDAPRLHTELEWMSLEVIYRHLCDAAPGLLSERIRIEQVYIGLCSLSADCSLRGTYLTTNEPFDVSYDLREDGIDKAMREAFKEILLFKETGELPE